jgi:hypothetical protein
MGLMARKTMKLQKEAVWRQCSALIRIANIYARLAG